MSYVCIGRLKCGHHLEDLDVSGGINRHIPERICVWEWGLDYSSWASKGLLSTQQLNFWLWNMGEFIH